MRARLCCWHSGRWRVLGARHSAPGTWRWCGCAMEAAMQPGQDRASLWPLHGARHQANYTVRARLYCWHSGRWRVLAARHSGPGTVPLVWLCNGSRHAAPTDRESLRLLHGAMRRRPTPCVLVSAAGTPAGVECLAARHSAPGTCRWFGFATQAAVQLRQDRASLWPLHGARH